MTDPYGRENAPHATERKTNYWYLFGGLSLLLLVGPVLAEFLPVSTSHIVNASILSGSLLLGVWSLVRSRITFYVGLALAVATAIAGSLDVYLSTHHFGLVTPFFLMAFLVLSVWHAGRDVLFGGTVDANRVVGALCIYEMIGLIWAVLYASLARISPAAFADDRLSATSPFGDFIYYSFVTLTTVGYGDVAPNGASARALAYMEALVGQLYITVLVAALVASYIIERDKINH